MLATHGTTDANAERSCTFISWTHVYMASQPDLSELADALGMEEGSYHRRSRDGTFSRAERSHLLRVARVLDAAHRLFGDRPRGLAWLKHRTRALSFQTPLSQLETAAGTERVLALLGRIDSGGFA